MGDKLNIEEIFRARLGGAEQTPSPQSWSAIQRKLRWRQFLRFNPGRFNIYYTGALLLASTGVLLLLSEKITNLSTPAEPAAIENRVELDNRDKSATNTTSTTSTNDHTTTNSNDNTNDKSATTTTTTNTNSATNSAESPPDTPDTPATPSLVVAEPVAQLEPNTDLSAQNSDVEPVILVNPATDQQTVLPAVPHFTSSVQSGCAPLSIQFASQRVDDTSSLWDFGTGDQSQEQNPVYAFQEPGQFVVTHTTENQTGEATVSRMLVEVLESPVADFQIDEGLEGVENHVVLSLVNFTSDASEFVWNLVDEECINCNNWTSTEQQPTLELKHITPDSRSVRLEVTNAYGCSDTTLVSLPLIVQSSDTRIKFATAFSPNPSGPGDGNFTPGSKRIDLFHPIYIDVPVEYHMRVYTRRGQLVFETREVYQGWDGYLHQAPAQSAVYVWMVEGKWADGTTFSYRGDITLVWNKYW
jgi:PKD repeat protein